MKNLVQLRMNRMENPGELGLSFRLPVTNRPLLTVSVHRRSNPGNRKESFPVKIDSPGKEALLGGVVIAGHCSQIIQHQLF